MKKTDILKDISELRGSLHSVRDSMEAMFTTVGAPVKAYKDLQATLESLRKLETKVDRIDWLCIPCGALNGSSSYPICEVCGMDATNPQTFPQTFRRRDKE